MSARFIEATNCADIARARQDFPDGVFFCYVWASWCVPCRRVGPLFEELASHFQGNAVFLKIDGDGCVDFLRRYAIKGIPSILAIKQDRELGRATGEVKRGDFILFAQEMLGKAA